MTVVCRSPSTGRGRLQRWWPGGGPLKRSLLALGQEVLAQIVRFEVDADYCHHVDTHTATAILCQSRPVKRLSLRQELTISFVQDGSSKGIQGSARPLLPTGINR